MVNNGDTGSVARNIINNKVVSISFTTTAIILTNQANSIQYLNNSGQYRLYFDATLYDYVKITGFLTVGSASINSPRLFPQYSINGGSSWITIGDGLVSSGEAFSLASPQSTGTNWIPLPAGAKGDVMFRIAQDGGDGAADPGISMLQLMFK